MRDKSDPPTTESLLSALKLLSEVQASDEVTRERVRRRRWFANSMLILGLFCAVVTLMPLPGKVLLDVVMWLGFAVTLLFVGAWQHDKASKEGEAAAKRAGKLF